MSYKVRTLEEREELQGLAYWTFEKELAEREHDRHEIQRCGETMFDIQAQLRDRLGTPAWVMLQAMHIGESHDLRREYVSRLFAEHGIDIAPAF